MSRGISFFCFFLFSLNLFVREKMMLFIRKLGVLSCTKKCLISHGSRQNIKWIYYLSLIYKSTTSQQQTKSLKPVVLNPIKRSQFSFKNLLVNRKMYSEVKIPLSFLLIHLYPIRLPSSPTDPATTTCHLTQLMDFYLSLLNRNAVFFYSLGCAVFPLLDVPLWIVTWCLKQTMSVGMHDIFNNQLHGPVFFFWAKNSLFWCWRLKSEMTASNWFAESETIPKSQLIVFSLLIHAHFLWISILSFFLHVRIRNRISHLIPDIVKNLEVVILF